jgi:methanogenic corrinoid protein MtbC1
MILWGWEQQLGIPSPTHVPDDPASNGRRYSERDIAASIWLREQILNGISPNEAAARLLGPRGTGRVNTGSLAGSGALSGPLDDAQRNRAAISPLSETGPAPRTAKPTVRLSDLEQAPNSGPLPPAPPAPPERAPQMSGPLVDATQRAMPSGQLGSSYPGAPGAPTTRTSGKLPDIYAAPASGPLPGSGTLAPDAAGTMGQAPYHYGNQYGTGGLGNQNPKTTGPIGWQTGEAVNPPAEASGPHWYQPPDTSLPPLAQPQGQHPSGAYGQLNPVNTGQTRQTGPFGQLPETSAPGVPWSGPGAPQARGRELRLLLPQFIRAFNAFDTIGANRIINEALNSRSVEMICLGLLLPALTRISDLTARHEASTPEERYALNYARSFLFSVFYRTVERPDGPLVFVCCGPKEMSEISALTLAVFWRRAGLRVAYFGADMDAGSLIEEVRKRRPALVSLSVSATQRIRSLARLVKALNQLDAPRPYVGFSGPIFVRNPELQHKVNGIYLGDDASAATWHVTNLLGTDRGVAVGS